MLDAVTGEQEGAPYQFAPGGYSSYDPVTAPGERGDFLILAATGAGPDDGVLTARLDSQPAWLEEPEKKGRLDAQPTVVAGATPAVVAIQKGRLVRWGLADGVERCSSPEAGLAATSNLVADGQGSVYFLNGGAIYGYAQEDGSGSCRQVARPLGTPPGDRAEIPEPPTPDKRLAFAADGSLLARSGKTVVAYHRLSEAPLRLQARQLEDGTVYAATTIQLVAGPEPAAAGATRTVWLEARDGITFSPGFRWPRNTVLRTRVFGRP